MIHWALTFVDKSVNSFVIALHCDMSGSVVLVSELLGEKRALRIEL